VLYTTNITYMEPANPAAFDCNTVADGGLHIIMTSWSDSMTTPGS